MKRSYFLLIAILLLALSPVQAQGLNVFLAASTDAPGAGDPIDYTLMVSNTGATTLDNVVVEVSLPEQIDGFFEGDVVGDGFDCPAGGFCNPGETVVWEVGTLTPGNNLRLTYPTSIASSPPPGDATTVIVASADNTSDIILIHDVAIDPSPLLRLSLVHGPAPAAPSEPFTYTLTYGNVGASSPTNVVLTMPVPDGTTFVSATEGGTLSGGVVTWMLGAVGVGAGGRVEVRVLPDGGLPPGATLEAEASLDSGLAPELVVCSEALTEVGPSEALRFSFDLSQNAVARSGSFSYTLTATNIGTAGDITGVLAELRLPEQIDVFHQNDVIGDGLECFVFCSPGETVAWIVGTLAPGQSRTIIMPTNIASNAEEGTFLLSPVVASATGSNEVVLYLDVLLGDEIVIVANEPGTEQPETHTLDIRAYPSPFTETTTFELSMPEAGAVRLVVYDALGRLVGEVVNGMQPAGRQVVTWDARELPSGIYFYQLVMDEVVRSGTVVKVR